MDEGKGLKGLEQENTPPEEDRSRPNTDDRRSSGDQPKKVVTPSAKRRTARHLVVSKKYSVRMACKTAGLSRSSYYYKRCHSEFEQRLIKEMYRLARKHPRYGYEMITSKLRQSGWPVNKKRIQRLWLRV